MLRPGGLLFFHTFNRTWLAYLVVIRGVPLLVRECPDGLHVYRYFIKPSELEDMSGDSSSRRGIGGAFDPISSRRASGGP